MVRKPRLFFLFCLVGGVRKAVPKLELRKEGGELTCAGIGGRSAHGAWRRKEGVVMWSHFKYIVTTVVYIL